MKCKKCKNEIPDGSKFCNYCGAKQSVERGSKRRGNGTGSVYKDKNGKYRATVTVGTYVDDTGKLHQKRVSKFFSTKKEAMNALATLGHTEKPTDITLHDLYNYYTSSKEYDALSHDQQQKLGYAWDRWKELEFRGITTLTVNDIQSHIEKKTSTYYPARDMKVILSHLYKIAMKREIVTLNKTEQIELPSVPKPKRECWTDEEISALWKDYESGNEFTAYPLIMCYAGLRYGELAALELKNIHLDESFMIGGIKTEAGIDREIPIHDRIKPLIERIVPHRKRKLLEMDKGIFYKNFKSMKERTSIRDLKPHACRHYYFSSMTAAGVHSGIIAEAGGHADYNTTFKNYVRVPLSDKINAVNKIK